MSLQAGGDHAAMAWAFKTKPATPKPSLTPTPTPAKRKIQRHDKVGVKIDRDGKEHAIVGTVTAVMGDTATVEIPPDGKTVDRYVNELWLMSHDKLESMNMSESEDEDDDDDNESNLISINCKGGMKVDVTPEQHEYLLKTFTEPVLATMVPEAIEVIVEDLENLESPLSNGTDVSNDSDRK